MCCCPLLSSSGRSPANGSATRSPPRRRRACGWAVSCRSAMTRASARSLSTRLRRRRYAVYLSFIVSSAACAGSRKRPTASGSSQNAARRRTAPSDAETWTAVRDQLATNARDHRRRADAAEPSLLAGVLVDARGERLTPSHAVKKGQRYRYYVSGALITEGGTDRAQGWRLPAQEIEDAVIRVLADALTSPARLLERFGTTGIPSDQTRKMLDRATRLAAALKRSPAERAKVIRDLIEKVIVEQQTITIRIRRSSLSGGAAVSASSEKPSDGPIELTAP